MNAGAPTQGFALDYGLVDWDHAKLINAGGNRLASRSGGNTVRLIIAIFLPFLLFFTIGRPIAGIICLILQLTVVGWLPAAIWAVYSLSQYKTDKKIEDAQLG